jgi:acetyl esterase/lipase
VDEGSAAALDPQLREALAEIPIGVDPGHHLRDMEVVRLLRSTPTMLQAMGHSLPHDDRVTTEDRTIPASASEDARHELPLRLYKPRLPEQDEERVGGELLPVVVFFHGGAFMIGDLYSEEAR